MEIIVCCLTDKKGAPFIITMKDPKRIPIDGKSSSAVEIPVKTMGKKEESA